MGCDTARELLGNYIDEELTEALHVSLDEHMLACPGCRADYLTLSATVASLKSSLAVEEASPWFAERLLHRLARENDTQLAGTDRPVAHQQLGLW